MEQQFIDSINENAGQGDRLAEYVYADWLDELGDPRGEAWRVLLGKGKRPYFSNAEWLCWWRYHRRGEDSNIQDMSLSYREAHLLSDYIFGSFFDAMTAAAVAWVRSHRDAEFGIETAQR